MNFGRILETQCVNVEPPPDARCNDEAFALSNPGICGIRSTLVIKPGVGLLCALGSLQFHAYSVTNGVEEDVTDEAIFTSGDLNVVVVGAISGSATAVAAGETTVTAVWQGKTATATVTVLSGDTCCEQQNVAMLLLVDTTRSMSQAFGGTYAKRLTFAKAAAVRFVGEVNVAKDTIGLMQFHGSTTTVEDVPGTDKAAVIADINALAETQDKTQFLDIVEDAIALLDQTTADRKVIILISDGEDTLTQAFNSENDPLVPLSEFKSQGGIVMCLGVRASGTGFAFLSAMATGGFFVNAYPDNVEEALDFFSGLKGYVCAGNCTPTGDQYVAEASGNYTGFANWDVTEGSVDLCGNGLWDFLPGNGLYVDMLGTSSPQNGKITSKSTFNLEAGHVYRVTCSVAGNQRLDLDVQSLRVRVSPVSGAPALLDTAIGIPSYTSDFAVQSMSFNSPGDVEVRLSFNQVEWTGSGVSAKVGLLLDNVRFEDVTTGTILLLDTFDSENLTYIAPGCGQGSTWVWLSDLNQYGYATGYQGCYGEGCLSEPPSAQVPDPTPLPNIESGSSPPGHIFTSTRSACADCPVGTQDVGTALTPILLSAEGNPILASASSECSSIDPNGEAWQAFDRDSGTYWASNTGVPQWLQIRLANNAEATSYGIRALPVGKPTAWKVYGSNDGSNFTELDSRTDPTGTLVIPGAESVFPITTPDSYLYYRLHVTAVNTNLIIPGDAPGGVARVGIAEFALYRESDESVCAEATATSTSSQADADSQAYAAALVAAQALLNCRPLYTSTQSHTAHCPLGTHGADVMRSATATSFVSLDDAETQALAAATEDAEGDLDCTQSNNQQVITINDRGVADLGAAPSTPYPSVKYIAEDDVAPGAVVGSVSVTISGFTHTNPADVLIVLKSPADTYVALMQRCGGAAASNLDLVIEDGGAVMPDENGAALADGTYAPTQYGANVDLPAPAVASPYGTQLIEFFGENPVGAWSLWVCDLATLDSGQIASGWDLSITFV
jgi:subtilisin-like proprotein convertase family protein